MGDMEMNVGLRIRERRTEINLTLKEIADRLGVQEATAQRYESGNIKNLKRQTILKISEILDVNPGWLMGWSENKTRPQYSERVNESLRTNPLLQELRDKLLSLDDSQAKIVSAIVDELLRQGGK
jgi:transcriptional regulator with XRE-family HTH domain